MGTHRLQRCLGPRRGTLRLRQLCERGVAGESTDRYRQRCGQGLKVIAALGDRDDASATDLISEIHDQSGETAELLCRDAHARERIARVRVEASRNEDQLRSKLSHDRYGDALIDELVIRVSRSGLERQVDGEAASRALTNLVHIAGARIERELVR